MALNQALNQDRIQIQIIVVEVVAEVIQNQKVRKAEIELVEANQVQNRNQIQKTNRK